MSLFPSPPSPPSPHTLGALHSHPYTNTYSHFPSHLLIRTSPSCSSWLWHWDHLCTWGVCYMLCNLGWRVQKTSRQGLTSLLLWGGKGGQLLVLLGDIIPPAVALHCPVHPSFCMAGSTNTAVQEQNKDPQLGSDGCSCRGLRSCSSGAAASLSSSLLSTFCLVYNYNVVTQLNFFLLQLSQGFSPRLVSCPEVSS